MLFAKQAHLDYYSPRFRTEPEKTGSVPIFPAWITPLVTRPEKEKILPPEAVRALTASISAYRRAVKLAPREGLYHLGLGWMLEQGAVWAEQLKLPPGATKAYPSSQAAWHSEALAAYRQAFALTKEKDLAKTGTMTGTLESVAVEAGQGIERLLKGRRQDTAESRELAEIASVLKTMAAKPRAITPLLIALNGSTSLEDLLDRKATSRFDLAGASMGEKWPWVASTTGILVWDPGRTGRITSGRLLFGSVTWWMFWKSGFAPLAALDDNHDGLLTNSELNGLAVWVDADQNGVSAPGEVRSLRQMGVRAVSVVHHGRKGGALWNPEGLHLQDGSSLPVFDWEPKEILPLP
jgi:hypothetical protein